MKIFVNARFLTQPLSGVQRYAIECSRQIKRLHPDVLFLAPTNIFNKSIASELDVIIIGKRTGHLWEQIDLPRYLANLGHPPLINLANTAPLFYRNSYVTIHDLAFFHHPEWNSKLFSMWYNFMIPRIARNSKHIFTVSNTVKEEICRFYRVHADKVSVTYNGISKAMLTTPHGENLAKEQIILTVGSFNIRKNHHKLIAAFINSNVKNRYRLILIGDKNKVFKETGLDHAIAEHNNITICQHLSEEELIATYQKAEILVSLSMYEGFGIPVLEGLFYHCKVLCSDIPVYRELFDGVVNFSNPTDVSEITRSLDAMPIAPAIEDERLRPLLAQYSYERSAQTILRQVLP